jgi:hypothetical protein
VLRIEQKRYQTKLGALINSRSQRKKYWLVRTKAYHQKSAALDISGHLTVSRGTKKVDRE